MNEPRRHHLLPRFYMRSFAGSDGQLVVLTRQADGEARQPYVTSPENILVERDFYAITDEAGQRSQVVEQGLADLERFASVALRKLLADGLVLDDRERAAWSEFMAVQVTRGRQFRATFSKFA